MQNYTCLNLDAWDKASNMCSVTVAVQTKGLEINACKKWGEGTLRNLFVLLCLLCTLPKPESWPIKYKIIYYINYTWEPFSLVMPTVGVHPSLKPDSRLAEEAAAVCVWVWLSVCGWISTAQPCYSPCGPGPQAVYGISLMYYDKIYHIIPYNCIIPWKFAFLKIGRKPFTPIQIL